MTNWKTISSKVSDETYGAMKVICEKENIKPNEFIRKAVEKGVQSILNKDLNPEVFPNIGENKFEYEPDSDSYMWIINFGTDKPLMISDNLGHFFVENLQKAIMDGVSKRSQILKKIKKNKTYIPSTITKFRKK
jgi:hypothetical protein